MVLGTFETADGILERYAEALAGDATAYRNHVRRLLTFTTALAPALRDDAARLERLEIAGAYHDLGIWTHRTFDYLEPSLELARAELVARGLEEAEPEVAAIIVQHHKVTPYRGAFEDAVEPFRRADLIEVSLGLVTAGLPRATVRAVRSACPNAGFHARLVDLSLRRTLRHPLSPLPMLRW